MKLLYIYILLICCTLFTACDMDTEPEGKKVTPDQKEETIEGDATKLAAEINGMFGMIGKQFIMFDTQERADDFGYPAVCFSLDLNGPDIVSPNSGLNWFSASADYNDRNDTYANNHMRWALFYYQSRAANVVLSTIPDEADDKLLLTYKGQAKAVRAFDYLSLAPYYQFKYKGNEDKPLVPIITLENEGATPRATVKEVYELIINELNEAIELLEGYERSSKSEIDQQVAYGLRARANLYMENWAEAAADAEKALAGYSPYSREDVSKPAFVNSTDANWMWAIVISPQNVPDGLATWPSWMGSFTGYGYTAGGLNYRAINTLLYNKIPSTDVRKGWWVDANLKSPNLEGLRWETAVGNDIPLLELEMKAPFDPYTNIKFGQFGYIGNDVNAADWCMMRAEEMILIQAEATAKAGNLGQGKSILENFVKSYRDPQYTSKAANVESFENEVWFQRRVELWGEGFSMSDIMRLGKPMVRFHEGKESNLSPDFQFNIAPNDGWLLMRLPQKETSVNGAIPPSENNSGGKLPLAEDGKALRDGVTD